MGSDEAPGTRIDPGFVADPAHLIKLGRALIASGQGEQALQLVERALAQAPYDPMVQEAAAAVLTHHVPKFHRVMLADSVRNEVYDAAIAEAVGAGDSVLDIGTGSGLLAMMAARAGAASVVACEANSLLAATAREIVAANGFSEIRVIAKHSTDLDIGEVGPPADVIVHEIFGHDVVGEGVLPAMADAVSRLGAPGVRAVPARASVRVALAHLDSEIADCGSQVPADFDLRLFFRHVRKDRFLDVGDRRLQLRSDPRDLFAFEFTSLSDDCSGRARVPGISTGGPVNGVVQWLRLGFDQGRSYENQPGPGASSHWKAVFHPIPEVLSEPGDRLAIEGWFEGSILRIWCSPDR